MKGILFTAAIALFAVFTPFPAVRFLAFLFLVLRVLSYVSMWIARSSVRVERADDQLYVNRFQQFAVTMTARNRSPFPIHYLTISDNLGGFHSPEPASFLLALGPGESTTISYSAEGRERGEFYFGPIVVQGRDAFGLFKWQKTIFSALRVVVYPTVYRLALEPRTGLPAGNLKASNRMYEDVTQFRSLREYIPGDELKRINWKVSARMGKLFTMEYVPSIHFPVLILLNLTDRDFPVNKKHFFIEDTIEIAASLVFFFVGLKQEVGLSTTGRIPDREGFPVVPIGAGYLHAVDILDTLARVKTSEEEVDFTRQVFRSSLSIPMGTKIMVASPPLSDAQSMALLGFKKKGYDVEVFQPSSHTISRKESFVYGIRSHAVSRNAMELIHG